MRTDFAVVLPIFAAPLLIVSGFLPSRKPPKCLYLYALH